MLINQRQQREFCAIGQTNYFNTGIYTHYKTGLKKALKSILTSLQDPTNHHQPSRGNT